MGKRGNLILKSELFYSFWVGVVVVSWGGVVVAQPLGKEHLTYLMRSQEVVEAVSSYEAYRQEKGRDDSDVLMSFATHLLDQGMRTNDPEIQISTLFGVALAHLDSSFCMLEQGIRSSHLETQLAAARLLLDIQDHRSDELLLQAMHSPFLAVRMEAVFGLATRKHRKAMGQIEALMHSLPQEMSCYFPQFCALIGNHDAIHLLKRLTEHAFLPTRIEAILYIGRSQRDDLLPMIRSCATHNHPSEQEACVYTLGLLKDTRSMSLLHTLSRASTHSVQLAALHARYLLGDTSAIALIGDLALQREIFAIALLGDLPGGEEILFALTQDTNIHVRCNATFSLLKRRDPRALLTLPEFLLHDVKDLGFQPQISPGRSMVAWKVVPSLTQQSRSSIAAHSAALALEVRCQLLSECLELSEKDFLNVVTLIFDQLELSLIPFVIHLMEHRPSIAVVHLLKKNAEKAGSPWIRAYCNLSLYRMNISGPYEKRVIDWITDISSTQPITFRPFVPWHLRNVHHYFELSAEEKSQLLLETYQAISERHDEKGIALILSGLKKGHPKNRQLLASFLLHTLQ